MPPLNWAWFVCVSLFALVATDTVFAQGRDESANEQRVALVIGNSSYTVGPLKNPVNDADDMASALRILGFHVTLLKNATHQQMVGAINSFGQELRKGGVGLFYFAGHGVQSRGNNFLIPINANLTGETQLEFDTVNANRVLSAMDDAGNRVNIMILDACRDNPFARSFRSSSRGLAQMEAAKGTYVAFATGPGSVAADGTARNGVYTEHLLKSLRQPESDIDRVFRRVAADVSRVTNRQQVPWTSSSLTGDFYFRAGSTATLAPSMPGVVSDPNADDRAMWESVKDSRNAGELKAYLDQFPNGIFAALARVRMDALVAGKQQTQVATIAKSPNIGGANPQVEIQTSLGAFIIELDTNRAPNTVRNYLQYIEEGFYDGTIFHRVIPGFMIQGGGFSASFVQKSTHAPVRNEADNGLKNTIGTVSMARTSDPHSATAQFFINVADNDPLNFRSPTSQGYGYTVFGKVVKGMDVVDRIVRVPTGSGPASHQNVPVKPVIIESVRLLATGKEPATKK